MRGSMQIEQPTTTTTNPDAVFQEEKVALERIKRLEEHVADREADAERCRVAFDREPTPKGHTDQAVADKKLQNARRDLEAAREEARPTIDRANERRRADCLEGLLRDLQDDDFAEELAALQGYLDEFVTGLRLRLDGLSEHVDEHNSMARQAANLSGMRALDLGLLSVEYLLLERLNPELAKTHGRGAPQDPYRGLAFEMIKTSPNTPGFSLELRQVRPLSWVDARKI
jgi:hypothetical protein